MNIDWYQLSLGAFLFFIPATVIMALGAKRKKYESLDDFNYHFNKNGELRDKSTKEGFKFDVHENNSDNQRRYELLSGVIKNHIYQLLEDEGKLIRTTIPVEDDDESDSKGKGFIFRSDDSFDCEKLVLIIHGNGVVRAGQWSGRLIINHSLGSGTQLPYIKKAKELGFGVLVLNSNQAYDEENGESINCSKSPEEHFVYVWENFVMKSKAKHVAIVAHSYGGVITTFGAANFPTVIKKTFAVAFTDSVHYGIRTNHPEEYDLWMQNNVCNWVTSKLDLDEPVEKSHRGDCPSVSAGTLAHIETSWKAFDSVWTFIMKKWDSLQKKEEKGTIVDDPIPRVQSEL